MLAPSEYRAYAAAARVLAAEYRVEAVTEKEPRKSYLLKCAVSREDSADFYEREADFAEEWEARRADREQEAA
jgi:hypothetical protein